MSGAIVTGPRRDARRLQALREVVLVMVGSIAVDDPFEGRALGFGLARHGDPLILAPGSEHVGIGMRGMRIPPSVEDSRQAASLPGIRP